MPDEAILQMRGMCKTFGSGPALDHVNFELGAREVHGLLGGNGAGKTTLMNVLYGLYRADAGEVFLRGKKIEIHSPKDALRHRIGMVHQHFLQIKNFTVIENIVLGTQISRKTTLDLSREEQVIKALCQRFSMDVDLRAVVEDLPMGARQKVEILKALYRGVEILILDEPTTNLTPQEVDALFQSLRVMVNEGMSIVFITHKLREVLSVCERISVLRNGKNVLTLRREDASEDAFVRGMVGDELNIEDSVIFSEGKAVQALSTGPCLARLEQARVVSPEKITVLDDVNLEIHAGEILGVAGVAGNGQRELAEVLVGVQTLSSGRVEFDDKEISGQGTMDILTSGVAYVPEDRLHDGFLPKANVAENLILGYHRQEPYSRKGFVDWKTVFGITRDLIVKYNIKTSGPEETGANLSGGNIQRVMIARAFSRPSKLIVLHNPTRGLDIPSMDFVYSNLLERKKDGAAILLLSENLDELLLLCDRLAVMYRGAVVGILPREQFDKYEIGRMMSGVRDRA